jgi:hypothetical protein
MFEKFFIKNTIALGHFEGKRWERQERYEDREGIKV